MTTKKYKASKYGKGKPDPADERATLLYSAHKRFVVDYKPTIESTFTSMARILKEHQNRHERAMFTEENYDVDLKEGRHNHTLTKEALSMMQAVKQLGDQYLKIQKEAIQAAAKATVDENLANFSSWANGLGARNRTKATKALQTLLYELEAAGGGKGYAPVAKELTAPENSLGDDSEDDD